MPQLCARSGAATCGPRAQGGAARSLWDCTGCGFIRHFPSRAARAETSSPVCSASLLTPADPPRAVPVPSCTQIAASPVCGLLGKAGPELSLRAGRLSPRSHSGSSGFSSPELSTLPGPHGGGIDTSLEFRVPGRRHTGRGRGLRPSVNLGSGTGAGPRAALDPPGLGRDSGWPAPCPFGYRRLRPRSSRAFRSCLSLTEARNAAGQTDQKARPCGC